ncbi:MAG TPA: hypothetical protein ENJ57_08200, partial [Rhizobiales bacterium]|nr:hypothetical protein [Hyphomicrobiales bacterium]
MLKSSTNVKTFLAVITGAAALLVSPPVFEKTAFTTPAMANEGGEGGSIDRLFNRMQSRRLNIRRPHRVIYVKPRRVH